MTPTECPHCRSTGLVESPAEPPHFARLDCGDCGRWLRWVGAPMTFDRAAAFVMPFGKHAGKTLAEIPRDYLLWGLEKINRPSIRRAIERFLEGPDRGEMPEM
jgi:hypothetical protein